jgi:hypothetical protein
VAGWRDAPVTARSAELLGICRRDRIGRSYGRRCGCRYPYAAERIGRISVGRFVWNVHLSYLAHLGRQAPALAGVPDAADQASGYAADDDPDENPRRVLIVAAVQRRLEKCSCHVENHFRWQ